MKSVAILMICGMIFAPVLMSIGQQRAIAQVQTKADTSAEQLMMEGLQLDEKGKHHDALKKYQQVLKLITEKNGDPQLEDAALNNMGRAYAYLGDHQKALELYRQAFKISGYRDDINAGMTICLNMGQSYEKLGDYDNALDCYGRVYDVAGNSLEDNRSELSKALAGIGRIRIHKGQFNDAEKLLYESIKLSESLRPKSSSTFKWSDRDQVAIADFYAKPYQSLQTALVKQNKTAAALEVSERGRGRILVELLASRLSTSSEQTRQKLSQPLTLTQIQQVAKLQNATLVQYSNAGEELYIWIVRPDGTIAFRKTNAQPSNVTAPSELRSATIAQLIETTRGAVPTELRPALIGIANRGEAFISVTQGSGEVKQKTDNSLRQLHQRLIEPIADLLPKKETERVIFLPQGELFFVPFAALIDSNGKYLIEKNTISIVPSIATLQLTAEKRITNKNIKQNALVIGNPIMPSIASGILKPLPGAEEEAKTIAPLLNTKPLIGAAATKSTVMKQMQTASIIHLATHGLLDSVKGDVPGAGASQLPGAIALTPDNPNEIGNGLLTANELFDLKLNANLVVLSACDTAKGDITGDGVIGLSRSLIAAGVPSIVVSLWSINDNSTSFLMKEFYRNLQMMNKAQALRQAMITTMKQPQYKSPYFWSAFMLIGEAE